MRLLEGYDYYKYGDGEDVIGIEVEDKYKISFTFREMDSSIIYDFEVEYYRKSIITLLRGKFQKWISL